MQKAIIEEFASRFAQNGEVLYIGDTEKKFIIYEKERMEELGIDVISNAKLPDVVLFVKDKDWVYFIESVTSVGPMTPERVHDIKKYCKNCKSGVIFITAFQTLKKYKEKLLEIAWDTEIWIAEMPDHMIHLNGDRFIGPRS